MSKEYLEAFETVYNNIDYLISDIVIEDDEVNGCLMTIKEQLPTIKHALQRLESIDNANPSEALKSFETLEKHNEYDNCWQIFSKEIKQALLKAQANARSEEILQKYYQEGITLDSVRALKQEKDNYKKVLEIVFKKNVDMLLIKKYENVSDYNSAVWLSGREKLTQEEFNTLKKVLEC